MIVPTNTKCLTRASQEGSFSSFTFLLCQEPSYFHFSSIFIEIHLNLDKFIPEKYSKVFFPFRV